MPKPGDEAPQAARLLGIIERARRRLAFGDLPLQRGREGRVMFGEIDEGAGAALSGASHGFADAIARLLSEVGGVRHKT